MSNSESSGCSSVLAIIATGASVLVPIFVGYKTWQWLSPDSFGEVLLWLIIWGVISTIVTPITCGLIGLIASEIDS